ncbi:MAG: DNA polymerase III subunit delta [Rubricella sp.]
MKLQKRDANRFFARPDPACPGILIYGPDTMRIALKREELVAALIGPEGGAEMRFSRLAASDIRSDKAALIDEMKARGFFDGPRALLVEDATDTIAPQVIGALEAHEPGDATLIVTAGQLPPRAKLRTFFEKHPSALCHALYADPPDRDEVDEMLRKAGIAAVDRAAMNDLLALAQALDPGDLSQTIEKLALYTYGREEPVGLSDIAAVAPRSVEADADDVVNAVAGQEPGRVAPLMSRIEAQGVNATTLCIAVTRHFRQLHAAAVAGGGEEALSRLRPPVFGPRRRIMGQQLRKWSAPMLETALTDLTDADLALRSGRPIPHMALLERVFVRLAMMRARR